MLEQSDELMKLQHNIFKSIYDFGLTLERIDFAHNVTLGRLKSRSRKSLTFQPKQILSEGFYKQIVIFQSEITPKGAVYTSMGEISLM